MELVTVEEMEPGRDCLYYSRDECLGFLVEKENLGLILERNRGYYYNLRFYHEGISRDFTCVGLFVFTCERLDIENDSNEYILK